MDLTKEEKFVREQISKIYDQLVINCEKTCTTAYERWGHDLLPMTVEMFLQKPIKAQLKVIKDGKLENMLTFMMNRQLKSNSSRFWHHYRKDSNSYREFLPDYGYNGYTVVDFPTPFKDEEPPAVTCVKSLVDKLSPFEKMVYNRIIIGGEKYIELSRELDIPYYTFKITTKKIKDKLNRSCQHLL